LLEVLVASAILSLVLTILYSVFSRTLGSKRTAEERVAHARLARIVLLRMEEDLQGSFPFTTEHTHFVGETYHSGAFPEASLSFVSFVHTPLTSAGREGDFCKIRYALVPDQEASFGYRLVRWVNFRPKDSEIDAAQAHTEEAYPLLSRVRGLRFRFFDGRAWHEEWGQDKTQSKLPRAVEVTLYLEDEREEATEFSTVLEVPLASVQRTGAL
jgi:type II secretion system protein J